MVDISVNMAGLKLKSPIIVGSSGLSRNVQRVKEYVEAGAGAIVLKSLFEEQIDQQSQNLSEVQDYPEAMDYIATYVRNNEVQTYIQHLQKLKTEVDVPIIASINCRNADTWVDFAVELEHAGADAIEVNIMTLDTDLMGDANKEEQHYMHIVESLAKRIKMPILVKISPYHSALPALVDKLRASGASGITLFNRGYQADIDIDKEEVSSADVFTHDGDFSTTLRYTALVSGLVHGIDISASNGVYHGNEVVKAILAGATSTQMCTAIYKRGKVAISEAYEFLKAWMLEHGYQTIDEMRGRLSYGAIPSAVIFERMQFMKYFSNRDSK